MHAFPLTSLAIALIVLLQFWFMYLVGKARGRSGIKAPALVGDAQLERTLRVQGNTIEQLAMFLPALLIALPLTGDLYAAILGGVWIVGRFVYAVGYLRDPGSRGTGFVLTLLPLAAALVCGVVAAARTLVILG